VLPVVPLNAVFMTVKPKLPPRAVSVSSSMAWAGFSWARACSARVAT
jgi:hypothetical protein